MTTIRINCRETKRQPTAGLEPTILWFEAIRVAITPRGLWISRCWQRLFHLIALIARIHSLIMITIIKVMWTLCAGVAIKDVTCVLDEMCNWELEDSMERYWKVSNGKSTKPVSPPSVFQETKEPPKNPTVCCCCSLAASSRHGFYRFGITSWTLWS